MRAVVPSFISHLSSFLIHRHLHIPRNVQPNVEASGAKAELANIEAVHVASDAQAGTDAVVVEFGLEHVFHFLQVVLEQEIHVVLDAVFDCGAQQPGAPLHEYIAGF